MQKISIISPVHNEEKHLPAFFSHLEKLGIEELVCIDGGSRDQSLKQLKQWSNDASSAQSRIVTSSGRGRGRQMNEGALWAKGEIFVFLHVDSALPNDGIALILEAMKSSDVVGGAFRLQIDSGHWFLKWITLTANLRSKYWGLPYGDQAYFVRRDVFERMGRYRIIPLMEDVDFFRRLKKEGETVLLKEAVLTSARRWKEKGIYLNSAWNALFLCLYFIGISPNRLAKWYYPSEFLFRRKN